MPAARRPSWWAVGLTWLVASAAAWAALDYAFADSAANLPGAWADWRYAGLALVTGAVPALALVLLLDRAQAGASERANRSRQDAIAQAGWVVLDLMPVPTAIVPRNASGMRINRAMADLLGVERQGSSDRSWAWPTFVAEADQPACHKSLAAARTTGQAQWLDVTIRSRDEPLLVLMQVAPLQTTTSADDDLAIVLHRADDAMARRAIQQLRELLQETESEKWMFGQAVHDELGQRLSGIAFFSKSLQRKLEAANRPEADDAAWLTDMANESMSVARGLARGLVPVGTDDPGALATMLNEQCQTTARMFNITCELFADTDFNPGGAARANHLYHAAQELITNAIKHGQASRVQVHLDVHADGQTLSIEDNGRGLIDRPPSTRPGMGLNGVRSRVALLGGQFSLVAASGGGMRALIELPATPPLPTAPVGAAAVAPGAAETSPQGIAPHRANNP